MLFVNPIVVVNVIVSCTDEVGRNMSIDLGSDTAPSTAPTTPRSPTSSAGLIDCEKGNAAEYHCNEKVTDKNKNDAVPG